VICLSGVCVSPLWPSETGFCPPPAQPELTENWEYLPAVPVRQQAGYLPYRHGRPGGRRLRAELSALVTFSIHYTAVSECCWELRRQPPPVTEPWLHTDCWRGFKPLVPSDKRFNHSKVWCTFISSSTTTVYAVQVCDCCCVNECYNIVVVVQSCCSVLLSCIYCIYCIYRYLPIDAIDAIILSFYLLFYDFF
jgi:hypothetical protein